MMHPFSRLIKNVLPYGIVEPIVRQREKKRLDYLPPDEPEIYNSAGQRMKMVFFKDRQSVGYGGSGNRFPRWIFLDRSNYGLRNHLYAHEQILDTLGNPVKKFAILVESETIDLKSYKLFSAHPGLEKDFDLIFTHSANFLDRYQNAVFIPGGGGYGMATIMHTEACLIPNSISKRQKISL